MLLDGIRVCYYCILCWNVILSCWQCHSSPSLPCDWFKEAIRELAKGGRKGGSLLAAFDLHSLNATWLNQFALGRDRWQLWVQKDVLRNVNIWVTYVKMLNGEPHSQQRLKGSVRRTHMQKIIMLLLWYCLCLTHPWKVRRVSWNVRICDN